MALQVFGGAEIQKYLYRVHQFHMFQINLLKVELDYELQNLMY